MNKNYRNYDKTELDNYTNNKYQQPLPHPPKKKYGFSIVVLTIIALVAIAIILIVVALSRGWKLDVNLSKQTNQSITTQNNVEQGEPTEQPTQTQQNKDETENYIKIPSLVYVTEYGIKYHRRNCEYLEKSSPSDLRLELAVQQGYEPCGACNPPQPEEMTVYITAKGEKFHTSSCEWLTDSTQKTTLGEAKSRGYIACGACRPLGGE